MIFFYLYISPYIITHFSDFVNRFFCLTEKNCGNFLLITRSWTWTFTYTRLQQQVHRIFIFLAAAVKPISIFFYLYISPYIITRFLGFVNTFSTLCQHFLNFIKLAQQCALWRRTFTQTYAAARFRALQNCGSSSRFSRYY